MKKIILAFLVVLALPLSAKSGDKIVFSAQDLNGNAVSETLFSKNKLTMINMWGTFCNPCIREMPDLAALAANNKSRGFEIAGIVIDATDRAGKIIARQKKNADTIVAKTGANYVHILPSMAMWTTILKDVQAVPTTIFVDKNGTQVGDEYIGSRSLSDWQKIVDELLAAVE